LIQLWCSSRAGSSGAVGQAEGLAAAQAEGRAPFCFVFESFHFPINSCRQRLSLNDA